MASLDLYSSSSHWVLAWFLQTFGKLSPSASDIHALTSVRIIVGVKYCFRYNQRARQLAALGDDGTDAFDLHAMPRQRRRREKKLMTMEDVNARFPLTKYKLWRASRQTQGLPTSGGVTAPPSRAGSIKEVIGLGRTSTDHPSTTYHYGAVLLESQATSSGQHPISSDRGDFAGQDSLEEGPSSPTMHEKSPYLLASSSTTATAEEADHNATVEDQAVDEDDPIRTAVPAEMLADPGDACAICLEELEDDDEVRGLTCGHAFHASCLDPWLTSRRACCPLCKADYYVPRPRPEGDAPQREESTRHIARPAAAWAGGRYLFTNSQHEARPSQMTVGGSRFTVSNDRYGFPVLSRNPPPRTERWALGAWERRSQRQTRPGQQQQGDSTMPVPEVVTQLSTAANEAPVDATPAQSSWFRNAFVNTQRNVPRLPRFGRREEDTTAGSNAGRTSFTPAQLEAGGARP